MPKKIRCFCCGDLFDDLETYRTHIFEDHKEEEGNLWLKCPHCEYPVRDLRSHYKVKHPDLKPPKAPQMRARIWKEWSSKKKKMVRSRKSKGKQNWKEGFFTSTKNGNQKYKYRSSWELYVMECLEEFPDVTSWEAETLTISYQLHGKQRSYIPDLLIKYKDGSIMVVEIKPKNQCEEKMNKAKWAAAKTYCDSRRWKFEVWTESYIVDLQRKKRALLEARRLRHLNPGIDIL